MLRPDFDDYRGIERASAQQPYAPKGGNNYKLSRTIATTS